MKMQWFYSAPWLTALAALFAPAHAWAQAPAAATTTPAAPPALAAGDVPVPEGVDLDALELENKLQGMEDIFDIKPPAPMPEDLTWLYYALGAAAVVLLALLAWWLWKRWKSRRPGPPPLTPRESAFAALDELAAAPAPAPKPFYFRLSEVLRGYIESTMGVRALEMTTEELLPRLERMPLPVHLNVEVRQFLRRADPIKYAGVQPPSAAMLQDLNIVRTFVDQTSASEQEQGGGGDAAQDKDNFAFTPPPPPPVSNKGER